MLLNPHKDKYVQDFVERKLVIRLRIFFFIIFILFDILVLEMSLGYVSVFIPFVALLLGLVSGLLFVRRKKIYWDEETSRVIARMDTLGIILLIVYVLFVITRHLLLHHLLQGNQLTAFAVSFATGGMITRVWSMRRSIRRVLRDQKII
ncbi:MAG: hypothetical protein ICV66_03565 [Chitinophagaceae bacterium]|nr:hypothetical protein [Chitinophagaceae bacterium]